MSDDFHEKFGWYNDQIAKKRVLLHAKRSEFLELDMEVQKLERDRARLFRRFMDVTALKTAQGEQK